MPGFGRVTMARRAKLLGALQQSELVRVPELADALNVSEITIRRDLDDLAAQGVIERFHGTHNEGATGVAQCWQQLGLLE